MRWITRENVKVDRVACPRLRLEFPLYDALYAHIRPPEEAVVIPNQERSIP
jgi:hypothetical protein